MPKRCVKRIRKQRDSTLNHQTVALHRLHEAYLVACCEVFSYSIKAKQALSDLVFDKKARLDRVCRVGKPAFYGFKVGFFIRD